MNGMLHFHNLLEIGYCYHGSGRLIIEDREYRYSDNMYTFIPKNVPHTTISDPGNICRKKAGKAIISFRLNDRICINTG